MQSLRPMILLVAVAAVGLLLPIFGLAQVGLIPAAQQSNDSAPYVRVSDQKGERRLAVNGVPYRIDVDITAGEAGDDNLAHGIYIFRINCSTYDSCGVTRIALNECSNPNDGEGRFVPRVDSWDTWAGLLKVDQLSNSEVELVVYQAFHHQLPATIRLTFDSAGIPFKNLTLFKTKGFIDLRHWPHTTSQIEYVPLGASRLKALDCPVWLRGLDRKP